ncbi:hypothetical protein G647_09486 [Cladophialophora carrionii CBS 160.54]|uniref:CMP/dCMP-type deaminase domain-containing protein n=1 Tax=Cladophialophora carrionii CBS 160.54 TaxID=1279043 RepID=V9DKQ5_9EURO|nr:uncharacterized protein G647_09486 [Cladophialophora carrionii CBS 160.54]ETI27296.1 hypothetical protein G647_09486 [Cladophialophora carrionii CBS 160.54]
MLLTLMPIKGASFTFLLLVVLSSYFHAEAHSQDPNHHLNNRDDLSHWPDPETPYTLPQDPIPLSTREHWMRRAVEALSDLNDGSPCPFAAFGCVIVNHSAVATGRGGIADVELGVELGSEVCIGANAIVREGNPTMHGEVAAINNCTAILTDPVGKYKLTGPEALKALGDLSLYTTAEACPMCSSAILYGGFKEYIFSTSIPTLRSHNWPQIVIRSTEIFSRSVGRLSAHRTRIVGEVWANETEELFRWQFGGAQAACPRGCVWEADGEGGHGGCVKGTVEEAGVYAHKDEL